MKLRWAKCGSCEVEGPCLYQSWGRCPVESAKPPERAKLLDAARRAADHDGAAPDLTVEQSMRIALCPARESSCHCVGKPAVCRRDDPDGATVVCLAMGPDGGPCPGVHHDAQ